MRLGFILWGVGEPEWEGEYAGIVEAILAAEDDEDSDEDDHVTHFCLSVIDFSFGFRSFLFQPG